MKLTFNIEYRTQWGETVGVILNDKTSLPILLSSSNGIHWEGNTEIETADNSLPITYRYAIYKDERCIRQESGHQAHQFCPTAESDMRLILQDHWRDLPRASYYFSSAFSEKTLSPTAGFSLNFGKTIVIRVLSPGLHQKKQVLGICGQGDALGRWEHPIVMHETQPNEWMLSLQIDQLEAAAEYKLVACNIDSNHKIAIERWENRDNRQLITYNVKEGETLFLPEEEVYFNEGFKVAGTAIPVFSLRSKGSFGVGDFGDLKTFVDWAVLTHQKAIQILPINDTTITNTWTDSYPYNSISIYAFHPMYIDLRKLPTLADDAAAKAFDEERQRLNNLPQIDYEAVNTAKRDYLHRLFAQCGGEIMASADYKQFFEDNDNWLMPYAAFSYLRDQYGTPNFSTWPEHQKFVTGDIAALCSPESACYNEISFYYYIQYILHVQLLEASNYAREKGVILKGDIPIGISRNSVEAWVEPFYFNMNGQAGAPPDAFSMNGQNWGFPTYNWDVMEQDNYHWWQLRFSKMAEYFTAYRIDHILGFFRIWEIPTHSVHGLLGQFVPALPMSVGEIQSFGLYFQKEFMTQPFINENFLHRLFGDKVQWVKDTFVQHRHHDIYTMRPEFDTQRKVEAFFFGKKDSESEMIREGLYALISNVLFVPDRKDPEVYHPRIAAQNALIFEVLSQQEKDAYNRLYNHYFYQRHNQFWYEQAMKKLPILTQTTPMLVCGEDLGMVPDCVPWVMDQLQILSLEIERMPKNPRYTFGHVWEYPYRSVCTISTHDMDTLRSWWEEDHNMANQFYNEMLGCWGEAPQKATGEICEIIVRRHLECPSMLCILSFQDWLSIDEDIRYPEASAERINIPANPRHYWRYRMHLTLEELMNATSLNDKIKELIDQSGRN